MSAGLFGLLDDVAALARLAAASVDDVGAAAGRASAKAAGVVVDDTAVTPQYVREAAARRELPIIAKIAKGSLRNKLLFILPAALVLSEFLPWLLTPLLMVGATYLCYEGAEKVWGRLRGHDDHAHAPAATRAQTPPPADAAPPTGTPSTAATPAASATPATSVAADETDTEAENKMIAGAIRTDFILSAEIMVIALNEVASESLVPRAIILTVVAIGITVLVYGVVSLIVKMDDVGLSLSQRRSQLAQRVGVGMVRFMPVLLNVISTVGVAAMLWVGGHILLVGVDDLGWSALYDVVQNWEEAAHDALGALGGAAGWLVNTAASAVLGLIVGAVAVLVMHLLPFGKKHADAH